MEWPVLSYSAGGMRNGTATLENDLAGSCKPEHMPFGSAIPPFVIYPTEIKTYIDNDKKKKNLPMNVYSSITHNSEKLEIIQMPFNGRIAKQKEVHSYNGILFSNIKEQHTTTLVTLKSVMLSKRSQSHKVTH